MALTKFNYNSFDVTPVASKALAFNSGANGLTTAAEGSMVLIKTLTADGSGTNLTFVDGSSDVVLDNTYSTYVFKFINLHLQTDAKAITFNGSDDDSSHSYDVTKTTTYFRAYHNEGDGTTALTYDGNYDIAQGTGAQFINVDDFGVDNDQSLSGELWLFNPSSTTFVKHFFSRVNYCHNSDLTVDSYAAGYFNTTADITAIQFIASSGNIDAGDIKLYGIKDS